MDVVNVFGKSSFAEIKGSVKASREQMTGLAANKMAIVVLFTLLTAEENQPTTWRMCLGSQLEGIRSTMLGKLVAAGPIIWSVS